MAKLWDKIKRVWIVIRSGLKFKSSGGENPGPEVEPNSGFLRLQRDVENCDCDCEDVHVLREIIKAKSARGQGQPSQPRLAGEITA